MQEDVFWRQDVELYGNKGFISLISKLGK